MLQQALEPTVEQEGHGPGYTGLFDPLGVLVPAVRGRTVFYYFGIVTNYSLGLGGAETSSLLCSWSLPAYFSPFFPVLCLCLETALSFFATSVLPSLPCPY